MFDGCQTVWAFHNILGGSIPLCVAARVRQCRTNDVGLLRNSNSGSISSLDMMVSLSF